ncbi:MAG TPA: glycosyltransferase [Sphingobacteriaceae bacterium]|nr:glycosyltransferase [Sphingobacteriaceae bacterium]
MKLSFVILNYNRKTELLITIRKTLDWMEQRDDVEIIIVDNASTDDSVMSVKKVYPDIKVIERTVNNGVAGWNDGFADSNGEYIVVLDDDSNIERGLEQAVQYMDACPQIGILALNIVGGAFQTILLEEWPDKQQCLSFIGCGALIRKKVYQKIGGFAEWLFIYAHEHEYAIRCYNAGFSIHYYKDCQVVHRTSNINRSNERLTVFTVRNEMGIIYKFFGKKRRTYIFRTLINRLKTINDSGIKTGYYVIKGFLEFLKIRASIPHTPVSDDIQDFYAKRFWSARPIIRIKNH